MSQAIVKIGEILPAKPFENLSEASQVLAQIRREDVAFLLTPLTNITEIKPFHQVSFRAVFIDPTVTKETGRDGKTYTKAGPHCYRAKFCKDDEVALGKNGLMAILAAAGANPVTTRLDDRSDPLYAEFQAIIYHQDFDGLWRQYPGTRAVDLRKGSPEANAMTSGQLDQARQFVAANAETKAILRALRPLFGLSQTYKIEDLKRKPFVIPKLVPHWDLNDPDQKKAALAQAVGDTSRLFGGLPSAEIPPPSDPGTPPPPVKEIAKTSDARPGEPPVEEEEEVFDDIPDKPSILVCQCPCDCQREITPEVAEITKTKTGGVARCSACFPGRGFNFDQHKGLKNLGIPKRPDYTAEMVREELAASKAKK